MPLEAPTALVFKGSAERTNGKKSYGVYIMECTDRDGNSWTIERRFSEFVQLKKSLIKDKCVKVKQMETLPHGQGRFPKKGPKSTDSKVMQERLESLDVWLGRVLKLYAENLNLCAFFKEVAAIKRDVGVAAPAPPIGGMEPEPQAAEEEDELEGFSYTEDDPSEMDMSFGIEEVDEPETPPSGADEFIIGTHEIGSVNAVCLASPEVMVSVGDDKGMQLWDLEGEKMLHRMQNNRIIKSVVALSETVVATGAEDGTIKTWDLDPEAVNEETGEVKKWSQRGRRLQTLEGHTGAVLGLATLDATSLVSASADGTVAAWEADTGTQICKLEGHEAAVNDVVVVDANTIASCSADRSIKVWHFAPSEPGGSSLKQSMDDCHKGQNVLCLCRISDTVIVSGGGDMLAKIWDLDDGGCMSALKGHTSAVQALCVTGDKVLASGAADMTVRLWDMRNAYKLLRTVGGAKGGINFSINGLCAISETRFASAADNIKIWSIEDSAK